MPTGPSFRKNYANPLGVEPVTALRVCLLSALFRNKPVQANVNLPGASRATCPHPDTSQLQHLESNRVSYSGIWRGLDRAPAAGTSLFRKTQQTKETRNLRSHLTVTPLPPPKYEKRLRENCITESREYARKHH